MELSTLYRQMKDTPTRVDVDGLFARLGVALTKGQVVFDDTAPLAATAARSRRRRCPEPADPAAGPIKCRIGAAIDLTTLTRVAPWNYATHRFPPY